jgi:hypothetical protein
MDSTRITYRALPGTTPEEEARALAAVYRLVLQVHAERQKGACPGTLEDDVMGENDAHTAGPIIPG